MLLHQRLINECLTLANIMKANGVMHFVWKVILQPKFAHVQKHMQSHMLQLMIKDAGKQLLDIKASKLSLILGLIVDPCERRPRCAFRNVKYEAKLEIEP